MFSEEFVKELPHDILKAQQMICEAFVEFREDDPGRDIEPYLQLMAFAQVFVENHSLGLKVPVLDDNAEVSTIIKRVIIFFDNWRTGIDKQLKILQQTDTFENAKDYYASLFGKGVFYEFSDDDYDRVQVLLNNIREILAKSDDFEEDHRIRMLKKLEALQLALHKRMSDFDRFWGFLIDSSIALRKFWENAEPFRDDVKEILEIVSRTQAKAENVRKFLPFKLLKNSDADSEKDSE